MKKFVIFFTITLSAAFLSISGIEPKASNNMELENANKKRTRWAVTLNGLPSIVPQTANKKVKITPTEKTQTPLNDNVPVAQKIVCRWNYCSKTYDTYPKYHDHFKEEHRPKVNKSNKFHCEWINKNGTLCNKPFSTKGNLVAHINVHTGKFKCNHTGCNKAFTCQYNLTIHKKTHTQEKPFTCKHSGCNKSFTQKRYLTAHNKIHTQEKPFICKHPRCNKSFAQKRYLTAHNKTHTQEKPFKCDYPGCGKAFITKSNLKRHVRTHAGKRPFKCEHTGCNKSFARKYNLTNHKKTHTGEKPFKCDYPGCGKACITKSDLKRHKKIHQPKSTCDICGKVLRDLNAHKKRIHNK